MNDWISVADRMPQEEDGGFQLVAFLCPGFGLMAADRTLGYFDNPADYSDPSDGQGWLDWRTDTPILVTHWMRLPNLPAMPLDGIGQAEFKERFGSMRPNMGNIS